MACGNVNVPGKLTEADVSELFCYCETPESDNIKVIDIPGITELYNGLVINVIFRWSSGAKHLYLDVNGLGRHPVHIRMGVTVGSVMAWYSGAAIQFTYSTDMYKDGAWIGGCATYAGQAGKLSDRRLIDGIWFDGRSNVQRFGVCETELSESVKVVSIPDLLVTEGCRISVFFEKGLSLDGSSVITMNVNGEGAHSIISYDNYGVTKWHFGRTVLDMIYYKQFWYIISAYVSERSYFAEATRNVHCGLKRAVDIGVGSSGLGTDNVVKGMYSHVNGMRNTINENVRYSGAFGYGNSVTQGTTGFAIGSTCTTSASYGLSTGSGCTSSGSAAFSSGNNTTAKGDYSHTEGWSTQTQADAICAHAEGEQTIAKGRCSHAAGCQTIAEFFTQTVVGCRNVEKAPDSNNNALGDIFVVGKGSIGSVRSNAFRVSKAGVYGTSAFNSTGADYAELFQWQDGNPNNEDRIGRFVTLDGEYIRYANPGDFILGILSGNPSVIGDVHDDQWNGMYMFDIYGRPIYEDVVVLEEIIEELDPEDPEKTITRVISPTHTERRQKINPDYDHTQKYIPRTERPEWSAVGMMGKLTVIDNGECQVNGWCTSGDKGIAVPSNEPTSYRVMSRLDDNHIRVLILPR